MADAQGDQNFERTPPEPRLRGLAWTTTVAVAISTGNALGQAPAASATAQTRCRVAEVGTSEDFPPGCHLQSSSSSFECQQAEPDTKVLIVWLEGTGPGAAVYLLEQFARFSVQARNGTPTNAFAGGVLSDRLFLAFRPGRAGEHFVLYAPDESPVDLGVSPPTGFRCESTAAPASSTPAVATAPPVATTTSPPNRSQPQELYEEGRRARDSGDYDRANALFRRVHTEFPGSPYAGLAARSLAEAPKPRPRGGFTIGVGVGFGYGGFKVKDPFYVQRTTTTYSESPIPTSTTVTGPVAVDAHGEGPALGLDCRLGWIFHPRIALLFDVLLGGVVWPGRPKESTGMDGAYATIGHFGVSGQLFVLDHLWTTLGLGGAFAAYQGPPLTTSTNDAAEPSSASDDNLAMGGGFSLLGSVGYELQSIVDAKRNQALSVEARLQGIAAGPSKDWATTVGLGYQWY